MHSLLMAIYLANGMSFIKKIGINKKLAFEIPRSRSIDIDDINNFNLAKYILS